MPVAATYLVAWGTVHGAASVFRAVRRARRRRQVRETLAAALGVTPRELSPSPVSDIPLPSHVGSDLLARTEGSYRGAKGPHTRTVPHGASRWTKVSLPLGAGGAVLRVRRDARDVIGWVRSRTGDAWFDETFFVGVASAIAACSILTPAVRRALLELPRNGESPRLTLLNDTLHLEWQGDPEPATVTLAIGALKTLPAALRGSSWA